MEAVSIQVQVKLPPAFPSGALERERNRLVSQHSWVVVTNERNASHEAARLLLAWRSARLQRKTGPRIRKIRGSFCTSQHPARLEAADPRA